MKNKTNFLSYSIPKWPSHAGKDKETAEGHLGGFVNQLEKY